MSDTAIKIENLRKQYKLGTIGGQTLNAELQSWWARVRGKEDPNMLIGQRTENFGESFWALDGINLEIKKGEAIGIIGANGAGKSTLLKILSRVTAPTEGDIWINGRIASMLEVGTGFHGELTGRENIYMNGAILGMTRKEVDEKLESIIDFSECRQFIDTPVKRYSSGMYVKLAFAVASHLDAEIMVMDEVLAVGDMAFQKKSLRKMGDEAHGGKTVLYVSHNMATIRNLCSRCIVLDKGKLVFDGDVEEAIEIYSNRNSEVSKAIIEVEHEYIPSLEGIEKKARICAIEFDGRKRLEFLSEETVRFRVKLESLVNVDELYLGMLYKSADTNIIGFDSVKLCDMLENETMVACFETRFDEFPVGKYLLHFTLFSCNKQGVWSDTFDQTKDVIFSVKDKDVRLQWRRDWLGYINFNNMKLVDSYGGKL